MTDVPSHPTRFGVLQVPLHAVRSNPTLQLERDLQMIENLDRLGFDEVFIGEHHSAGSEIIGCPEMFLAAAAQRTTRIKLGTGVVSVPYHNPFHVAERAVLLDHLCKGRHIMGVGPGSLTSDAHMLGIAVSDSRRKLHEGLDVIIRLLEGEIVTELTDWYELVDARLQLASYSRPRLDMVAACVGSPTGPRAAGKYGMGMINFAANNPEVAAELRNHWSICEEEAERAGRLVRRDDWRLCVQVHLADTDERARKDVRHNFAEIINYLGKISVITPMQATAVDDLIDEAVEKNVLVLGTPDRAIELIDGLTAATGGFGGFNIALSDAATYAAQQYSLELFAEHVIPHYRDQIASRQSSFDWVLDDLGGGRQEWQLAIVAATEEYAAGGVDRDRRADRTARRAEPGPPVGG